MPMKTSTAFKRFCLNSVQDGTCLYDNSPRHSGACGKCMKNHKARGRKTRCR